MSGTTSTIAPHKEQLSEKAKTYSAKAYTAKSASSSLAPASIQRRAPRPQDVEIEILYCGVCHSDLHQVRDEWHAFRSEEHTSELQSLRHLVCRLLLEKKKKKKKPKKNILV